jgi:hypothetical protein
MDIDNSQGLDLESQIIALAVRTSTCSAYQWLMALLRRVPGEHELEHLTRVIITSRYLQSWRSHDRYTRVIVSMHRVLNHAPTSRVGRARHPDLQDMRGL